MVTRWEAAHGDPGAPSPELPWVSESARPDLWGPGWRVGISERGYVADYGRMAKPEVNPRLGVPGLVEAALAADDVYSHTISGDYEWTEVDP